ncbi:MAG: hypothetical protein Q9191_004227 [Dirinaria sp. TL-2023a]
MFQRLKGAIDSRIAEEQARQRASQASPSRSLSSSRRPTPSDESPTKRPVRAGARGRKDGESIKAPDPADFEPEFVIGESETPSRSGTPRPVSEAEQKGLSEPSTEASGEASAGRLQEKLGANGATSPELPTDVRAKLRKLEKLESKYHELLRSYRIAHARVQTIEPFESSLREHTPLISISDPDALVEYLNQLNLKGDMVLDELKRVSNDRDAVKKKLAEAENDAKEAWSEVARVRSEKTSTLESEVQVNGGPLTSEAPAQQKPEDDQVGAIMKSPTESVKSRKGSLANLSIFSPKSKAIESPTVREEPEELFSYDSEMPRMEAELKEKQGRIEDLQGEITTLKGDLAVTRESTQSMASSLEEATRELHALRDRKDRSEGRLEEERSVSQKKLEEVKADLHAAEDQLAAFKVGHDRQNQRSISRLEQQLEEARQELDTLRSSAESSKDHQEELDQLQCKIRELEAESKGLRDDAGKNEKRVDTLNGLVSNLRNQLKESEEREREVKETAEELQEALKAKLKATDQEDSNDKRQPPAAGTIKETPPLAEAGTIGKKKNKKKKKGKSTNESISAPTDNRMESKEPPETDTAVETDSIVTKLQEELEQLRTLLQEKDDAIEKVQHKLKDQDDLRDEIESLRDDLVHIGQEHVEAKDRAKELLAEKTALQNTISDLEKEIADLSGTHASRTAGSEKKHNDLLAQFEELKAKSVSLQIDLSAAEQLATARFKDISELRSIVQKAQPELNNLRSENTELKSVRVALSNKEVEVRTLEAKHQEMRSEITKLKQTMGERDNEIKILNQKLGEETSNKTKAEEAGSRSAQEVQRLTTERRQANESIDRLSRDLSKAQDELVNSKSLLRTLEQQLSRLRNDNEGLKEEAELKTAQYSSAQSLMSSMRDQTAEMAMQMKEARERCESLDDEVAEAHRLLSERSREGETMRGLLADVERRADARVREMKERMDTAIEERDRAEDESNMAGRRRAREMEEMRNKVREAERNLKRVEEDKEELEQTQRDWKRRREELEQRSEWSLQEAAEARNAMGELRDALDESEKQARDLEKQKAELRRSVEETQHRLEKLQKANKVRSDFSGDCLHRTHNYLQNMAEELRTIQSARPKLIDSGGPSSRSSIDSGPGRSRLASPTPAGHSAPGTATDAANGQALGSMDYFYLKNVLLQFLEQKDKNHQKQLIPVLGKLLHFDGKDEQKWMSAISAR